MLDLEYILARADFLYDEAREDQCRRLNGYFGIQSEQIKAITKAIVEAINEELSK